MTDGIFAIGHHRPVYLWAGPGTVRMNRLKFMGAPVDESVHAEAHTRAGARRMADEAAFNCAYLMYNWGFPPEVEAEDWADFRRAVGVYHDAGISVFGYVQLSNCVYDGSFRDRTWYVEDPVGRRFHYYTGRYMTCWLDPAWREHLKGIITGIVDAGADGVFFDNPWHGAQPLHLASTWMGPAGCYCARCRAAFRAATGFEIPASVRPESDETSRAYLRWRAGQVTRTVAMLADHARALQPDVVISANDFDAVMRPSYLVYGIDLAALARVQDVAMIEDYGLPHWDARQDVLANNALTLRTARALVGGTPLSTNPYDKGIGFDPVYPARRLRQGIAEAAACGATMVVKGTEYVDEGAFTLLTAERYAPQRQAIGQIHRWLEAHAPLYRGGRNTATVALEHPGDRLWQQWDRLAPLYFGAGQVLTAAGVPWRVVQRGDDLQGVEVLLTFDAAAPAAAAHGVRRVEVPALEGWQPAAPSFLARSDRVRAGASRVLGSMFQGYFRWRWARRLVDGLGLVHFFWQTPYFRLPPRQAQAVLLAALGAPSGPRVEAAAPVLVELWQRNDRHQLHVVNYGDEAQRVILDFGAAVAGRIISPDGGSEETFEGTRLELAVDVYAVLEYVPST
jgi:hypothetical protein